MTVIKADSKLSDYLAPLKEETEIEDANGTLLGVFIPAGDSTVPDYTEVRKLFDPEEIKRRKEEAADQPGYTTAQVLEHLRTLESPS